VHHIEILVGILETFVDRLWRPLWRWKQGYTDVLQEDRVDLGDRFRCPVVFLHQLFAGSPCGGGCKTQLLGQHCLVLEEQTVFAAADVQVQVRTQPAQEGLAPFEDALLLGSNEAEFLEVLPATAVTCRLRNPQDHLQIAQASWALLAVRLQAAGCIAEALVAVLLLHAFGLEEGGCVQTSPENRREPPEQGPTAGKQPGLDHRRLNGDVAGGFLQTLFHGSHGVAGFESDVPKDADQLLQPRSQHAVWLLRQQDQQVNVGGRVQFTSTVAANCNQGKRIRQTKFAPDFAQHCVDQLATLAHESGSVTVGKEIDAKHPLSILEASLQARDQGAACRRRGFHRGLPAPPGR
jgi:hypothetical protein